MKHILLLLAFLLVFTENKAQNISAEKGYINAYANARLGMFPRRSLLFKIEKNTFTNFYRGTGWYWGTLQKNNFVIGGRSSITLADALITNENAKNYRYRILQNDNKELVGWTIPNKFSRTADGSGSYAELGKISYQPDQFIQVEIYNVKNYKDRDALIIDWRPIRPFVSWMVMQYRSRGSVSPLMSISLGRDRMSAVHKWNFIETKDMDDIKFRLADSLVSVKFTSQRLPTLYNYQVMMHRTIQSKTDTINLGDANHSFELRKEFWDTPGRYRIIFTPKLLKSGRVSTLFHDQDAMYQFTVLPPVNRQYSFSNQELILTVLAALLVFFGAIFYGRHRNTLKLKLEQQKRAHIKIQLQAIRSQLNPHFMFNALASIQNLMTRNDMDTAVEYLGRFARITRHVLLNKEMVTLQDEYNFLDDYLSMEQLRFGFDFDIHIGEGLEITNIEIPSMLLQVFAENAVKHGVSSLRNKGKINILFEKNKNTLIITIMDNGSGFDTSKAHKGFGLQLSKARLGLLNDIYKDSHIELLITAKQGTMVVITLCQWL